MIESSYNINGSAVAAAGVRGLRRAMGAEEITRTALAEKIGMSRQTLSGRFARGDMKLSEFAAAATAVGRRPSALLAEAEESVGITVPERKEAQR